MGYWKTKVLPKIKKVFDTSGPKKAAAAEAAKSFDGSKEEYSKEFEEKKADLQPKAVEIYEASSSEIKTLVKDPKEADLKKNSAAVQKFLDDLVKIEFPGSKPVSEAYSKFGATVSTQVFFIFEKVSTFIVTEEAVKVEERAIAEEVIKAEEAKPEEEVKAQTAETSKDKEVAVDDEKKEDIPTTVAAVVVEEKKELVVDAPPKLAVEAAEPPKRVEEATPEQPKP